MKSADEIVSLMMKQDAFTESLGIEIKAISEGYCQLTLKVKEEMTNGFGIAHGGISYCLADSTLAFASNSKGRKCVSIETSISHLARVNVGDVLISNSKEIHFGNQIAVYEIEILTTENKRVAHFKGTVKVTEEFW